MSHESADSLRRLRTVFVAALERDGLERERYLAAECRDEPALRAQIQELLDYHAAPHSVFDERSSAATPLPDRIGVYRIVRELGHGGMGTVYLAEQGAPVRRQVALKVVRVGMGSEAVLRRFEAERRALALMDHDAIARVFDAGTTPQGQPYFVMEYAPGLSLVDYCQQQQLALDERLTLFCRVCRGVEHAHQKGVIHRDLKPGNVLVTDATGVARVKIIDFGLARATRPAAWQGTLAATQQGQILGTPQYMSPEQADPSLTGDLDSRTDIYSLGVMLYELLTGERPFPDMGSRGLLEVLRIVREEEPPRPSSRLENGAESVLRPTPALHRALQVDLDWVVLRAMAKDPGRRYDTAAELAEELERFMRHEPLLVRPPSRSYRLAKLVQRHRRPVVGAASVLLALLVAGAGIAWFAVDARTEARRAERNAAAADAATTLANARAAEVERQRAEIERTTDVLRNRTEEFDLLSLAVQLDETRARERELYPAWPARRPAMRQWLDRDVAELHRRLPRVREVLASLRVRTAQGGDDATDEAERFLRDTLARLLDEAASLDTIEVPAVRQRLTWAAHLADLGATHAERWRRARAAIAAADGVVASRRYAQAAIDLQPQIGLVPIGMNPKTRLWEFYHLRSAWNPRAGQDPAAIPIPMHDPATGHVQVTPATGIVFVLLPGGTFAMGAQRDDPAAANYDPLAAADEGPVHSVTLAPFFMARHELSRGQWARLSRDEHPGYYATGLYGVTDAHPVEFVSWVMCDAMTRRHGLVLPSEAQWEYACRAGTSSPWWTGADRDSLVRDGLTANLADQTAARAGARWSAIRRWPELDDGWIVHAPVGAFRANAFGLHHVHGNVWEWCREPFGSYAMPKAAGDGLRPSPARPDADGVVQRVDRGGGYQESAPRARAANRGALSQVNRGKVVGMRAARALEQS
ncbi:MAG: bifunctional serine/threonine-protein kinase/formylglycine-generating enzyme family protein [Planctomycetota bacterium]